MKLEWEKATDTTMPDTEAKKKLKPYFHLGVGDIPVKDRAGLKNKDFVPAGQVVQIYTGSAKIFTSFGTKRILFMHHIFVC